MAGKSRVPMQVSPVFELKIKQLQQQIMGKHMKKESLRDLTEKIAKSPSFNQIEKAILNAGDIELKINFDRRKRCDL